LLIELSTLLTILVDIFVINGVRFGLLASTLTLPLEKLEILFAAPVDTEEPDDAPPVIKLEKASGVAALVPFPVIFCGLMKLLNIS
jgi:hypothetical protein